MTNSSTLAGNRNIWVADDRVPPAGAPVTCERCGCRLQERAAMPSQEPTSEQLYDHFGDLGASDARGCRVPCVSLPHTVQGQPLGLIAN